MIRLSSTRPFPKAAPLQPLRLAVAFTIAFVGLLVHGAALPTPPPAAPPGPRRFPLAPEALQAAASWIPRPEWARLLDALQQEDIPTIESLITSHPGLAQAHHGVAPVPLLPWAASRGATGLLRALLAQGALTWDPPASVPSHLSALAAAALAGERDSVDLLLKSGADPNGPSDPSGLPPITLLVAAWARPVPVPGLGRPPSRTTAATEAIARSLLNAGANLLTPFPGHPEFLVIPRLDTTPVPGIEFLLTNALPLAQTNPTGFNLLHAAVLAGATNALPVLLAQGADPRATNHLGDTPLHTLAATHPLGRSPSPFHSFDADSAARHLLYRLPEPHRQQLARQLLRAGGQLDVFTAAGLGQLDALTALVQAGPDRLRAVDTRGWTALHWAVLGDSVPAVERLLRLGASLGAVDEEGRTPLHLSLTGWRKETTLALVKAGAPLELPDRSGRSPLALATHSPEAVSYLLEQGAPPDGPGSRPPLLEAAHHLLNASRETFRGPPLESRDLDDREAPVRALLRAGANTLARNAEGQSALDLALAHAGLNLLELLVDHGADLNRRDDQGNPAWFAALRAPPQAAYHPPIPWTLRLAKRLPDWLAAPLAHRPYMPPWPPLLHVPVLPALARYGATLAATNAAGQNALHIIAGFGPRNPFDAAPTNSLGALLEAGLGLESRDAEGFTPWLRAWRTGSLRFANTLVRQGAHTDVTTSAGENAIHLAVRAAADLALHFPSVLPSLRSLRLDPDARNAAGQTPADLARSLGLTAVATLLEAEPDPTPESP